MLARLAARRGSALICAPWGIAPSRPITPRKRNHRAGAQIRCFNKTCPLWEGQNCVYNGVSDIWKVCNDRTCSFAPDPPKTNLDKCDPLQTALDNAAEIDTRASAYCEYRNWRVAGTQPALTGHTGRCTNADPTKCHGGCHDQRGAAVAASISMFARRRCMQGLPH